MDVRLQRLMGYFSKLPGQGPRAARRALLHLLKYPTQFFDPFLQHLLDVRRLCSRCNICGGFDCQNPCAICCDPSRDRSTLCVVGDAGDIWILERLGGLKPLYHVLGGALSSAMGVGPEDLFLEALVERFSKSSSLSNSSSLHENAGEKRGNSSSEEKSSIQEIIFALNPTFEGQATVNYVSTFLKHRGIHIKLSVLARGIPMGGELEYMDKSTLLAAWSSRQPYDAR